MRELLFSITKKDFEIQTYKASGKGGQNRNKRETAIRLIHKESGIKVTCADEREQHQNLKKAFRNLINKEEFKMWLKLKTSREMVNKKEIEKRLREEIDDWVQDKFIKVEYFEPER
jgi:protein subunit release factor B